MRLSIPFISSFSHTSKAFLKDSSLLFVSNIINAALNYGLIIFVSNKLLPGNYSLWTAITGVVAILLTFSAGIMTEFNKTASVLAKDSIHNAFEFYYYFLDKVLKVLTFGLILAPIFTLLLMYILGNGSFWLLALVILNVYLQIILGINNNFVISLLEINKFMVLTFVVTAMKFIATILLIFGRVEVIALPLGLIISELVGLSLGVYYLKKIKSQAKNDSQQIKHVFKIFDHVQGTLKTVVIMFFLSMLLNAGPIIAERYFGKSDKDILAILFNFGQIIHFGAVAFLSGLVTHASRSENKKIFYSALGIVISISFFIGFLFSFFGEFMMRLFGRGQYANQIGLILLYSVFILFYNVIFVCVQYLIIKNKYRALVIFPIVTVIYIISLVFYSGSQYLLGNSVKNFITISVIFGFITAIYLVLAATFKKSSGQK